MSIDRRYRLLKSNIEVSDLVSTTGATIPPALLGTGTADSSKFLRGDGAWSNALTAPLSAISALTLNGAAGAYTLDVVGSASSSNSYGLLVQAGTNSADLPVQITNKAGSSQFLLLFGDGHGTLGPSATSGMQWTAGGNFNIAPPASGVGLTVNAVTNGIAIDCNGSLQFNAVATNPGGVAIWAPAGNTLNFGVNFLTPLAIGSAGNVTIAASVSGTALTVGTSTSGTQNATIGLTNFGVGVIFLANQAEIFTTSTTSLNIGTAGAAALNLYTSATNRVGISSAGNITVTVPTSGTTLTLNGASGANTLIIQASTSAGNSGGILLSAGTNASDNALVINNASNSVQYLRVAGDGGVILAAATGGDQGLGTLNATGLFINGVAVSTAAAATGSFTGTFTGLTSGTATCTWTKVGTAVTLFVPVASGTTSNSTAFGMTGLPAAIQPATAKYAATPGNAVNSGASTNGFSAQVSGGTMTFLLNGSTGGWTATGTKAVGDVTHGACFTWDTT